MAREEVKVAKRKAPSQKMMLEVLWRTARCANCDMPVIRGTSDFDHILPLELGGEHDTSNLQLLCEGCHKEKPLVI